MKKLIALSALVLTACTSAPTQPVQAVQTQVQITADKVHQGLAGACPLLQATVDSLNSPLVVLPVSAKADIAIAQPIIDTACEANYSGDLEDLVKTAIPNLENSIMSAAGLGPQARNNLVAAQIVVTALYNAQKAGQVGGTALPAAPAGK